ncbi:MAG TPA: 16S rRNA (cytosine(1402)-N(4))-methyltransferase RsmH [Patescibacteria group bacterium]|nr:16S rRNA (cytosine(1402)-N(4))-methyltransferase RsmH [Patescibacteria group bacterium]
MDNSSRFDRDFHIPVLLKETIEALEVKKDSVYVDGTIGGGGHTEEILKLGGRVLGIDQDQDAILHLNKKFESEIKDGRLILAKANFRDMEKVAKENGIKKVSGILLDLGVSSYQIDKSQRGFSFRRDEPLDMRMSDTLESNAYYFVNKSSEEELYEMILKFGEEAKAKEIASAIVMGRQTKPIETTFELSQIIGSVVKNPGMINPATKTFQAIRIVVNDELGSLRDGLSVGFELLDEGGRFSIISFHSLEDRVVKLFFLEKSRTGKAILINKKPILAGDDEIRRNKRSRSAKLRTIQKI